MCLSLYCNKYNMYNNNYYDQLWLLINTYGFIFNSSLGSNYLQIKKQFAHIQTNLTLSISKF